MDRRDIRYWIRRADGGGWIVLACRGWGHRIAQWMPTRQAALDLIERGAL